MKSVVGIVILLVGIALLVWGVQAYHSVSSGTSEIVQGAPSNKAIVLLALGAVLGVAGLVRLMRRA
jgi:uncharacterized membrane protein YidH (DUF202 family)